MTKTKSRTTLGALADAQAERNPRSTPTRGRIAGGGKPTDKPLVANGRPLRRHELEHPEQASEEVASNYQPTKVITLGAIGDMTIDVRKDVLDIRLLSQDVEEGCFTQIGDVVISLSAPFSSACIDKETTGLFIPNTCAVIRMDKQTSEILDPWFLVGYLNLGGIKDLLERKPTSSRWKTLRIEDLRSIEIPLPDMDAQKALARVLQSHVKKIRTNRLLQQQRTELIEQSFALMLDTTRKKN